MFTIIAMVIVVLNAVALIYAATRPNTFRIEHSISIKAPPEKFFLLINDFHAWDAWWPYNKGPTMKKKFSVNADQVATYAWEDNRSAGQAGVHKERRHALYSMPGCDSANSGRSGFLPIADICTRIISASTSRV